LFYATELGWAVFPSVNRWTPTRQKWDKVPHPCLGKQGGFHRASASPEQVAAWWTDHPTANIALFPASGELVILDLDTAEGERFAASLGVGDGGTLTVLTGRDGNGRHFYYRCADAAQIGNRSHAGLDVRAGAGYVIAPPSVHPTGRRYAWRDGFDFDRIAELPDAALRWCLGSAPRRAPSARPALPLASRPLTTDRVRHARKYLTKCPTGLSDGRKTTAYRISAALLHDVGMAEVDTGEIMRAWNDMNSPPLEDGVLTGIVHNAHRYGGRRGGAAA
jgi:hypothetical protein